MLPIVSVTPADISGLVGEQQVKDLPLNGRSYDELMTLNPGVVNFTSEKTGGIGISNSTAANMFSVAGNRPQQNMFLLNGMEYTGAAENNMQPGGISGQMLGVDAVREFNLLRDTYGAEYGKHPGGQVTIVTQSGTNQWHGSILRISEEQCSRRAQFFRSGVRSALPAQSVRRVPWAGQSKRTRPSFSQTMKGSGRVSTRPAWRLFPMPRPQLHRRSGCSVRFMGQPVVVGTLARRATPKHKCLNEIYSLLNLWPVANGPDFKETAIAA